MKRVGSCIGIIITLSMGGGCSQAPTRPEGGNWTFELVAAGEQIGLHSSLTTTSDGSVHLFYHDAHELTLNHARRTAPAVWEISRLDTVGWKGEDVAVSCGLGDTLHLAYRDIFVKDLIYARFDGTGWEYERIDPFRATGEEVIIDYRGDGVHMLDMQQELNQVNYWQRGSGEWTLLSSIQVNGPRSSLALAHGPTGPALALFVSQTANSRSIQKFDLLFYIAADPSGPWSKTILLSGLLRTDYTYQSLAMDYDDSGRIHVLYRQSGGDLVDLAGGRVARGVVAGRVRIDRAPGGELWALYPLEKGFGISIFQNDVWRRMTTITGLDPLGKWAMFVDGEGTIHISVYSHAERRLWYGWWEPGP
ncbi:hypothetical protein ACFL3H_00830 [Gemmatimonadota bacterium]